MMKRIGILIFALVAALGLLAAALLIFATSAAGSRMISDKLRKTMKQQMGLNLSFDNIDLDFFPPRIKVISVKASDDRGRVSCNIEEAELAPRPLDLFRGELGIEEVYVGSPKCKVWLKAGDIDQIISASQKKSGDKELKELDLSILPSFDVFAMSSAEVELSIQDEDRIGTLKASVKGLGLDVTGGVKGIEVRGFVDSASTEWSKKGDHISETLEDLTFRTAVLPNAIKVRYLNLSAAGANVQARNAQIPFPFGKQTSDISDISAMVPLDILNRLPLDFPHVVGEAAFVGTLSFVEGSDGGLLVTARGRAGLDNAAVGDFIIGSVRGHVSYSPKGVVLADTVITTADGSLDLSGSVAFDDKLSADIDARLHGIELGHLLEQVTIKGSYVTQKMSGTAKLKGSLKPFRLRGTTDLEVNDHTVRLDSFHAKNAPIALYIPKVTVRGPVDITDSYFEGKKLKVHSGRSDIDVDLRMNYEDGTWRLLARSQDLHMEDVNEIVGFKVGGNGPVSCLITGFLWAPEIIATASFNKFVFDKFDFDKGSTDISFSENILAFEGISLSRGQSKASIAELLLDFSLKKGIKLTTKIEAERVAIKDLAELFDIDTKPFGSLEGDLFGRVAIEYETDPERLRIDADLVHENLVIFNERFGSDSMRIYWDEGDLTVPRFDLPKGKGTISITGTMRKDSSLSFLVVAKDIKSEAIDNQDFKKLGITTQGQLFALIEGTLNHPQALGDIELGDAVLNGMKLGSSRLKFALNGTYLTLTGDLLGKTATIEHSVFDFADTRFELEAFVYDFDIFPILNIETYGRKASLRLTGEAALKGKLSGAPDISGHAVMNKVKVVLSDMEFENKRPLNIVAKKSQFQIDRTRFLGTDIVFDLKGILGLEALNIDVKGLADLSSVDELIGWVDTTEGKLRFELSARGPYSAPSLRGSAELNEGLLILRDFPQRIERIFGRVSFTPKLIRFYDFTAGLGEGVLAGQGELRLSEGKISDYLFMMNAENVRLRPMDNVSLTASTLKDGIVIKRQKDSGIPQVKGDVEVKNLRYTQDIRMIESSELSVERLSRTRLHPSKPKLIEEKNNLFSYDIRLHGAKNLKARNNLIDANLSIDDSEKPLRIVGTNQVFGFLGRIFARPGQVRFAGKRFDIQYAEVDFKDEMRLDNPNYYITADSQIRDWKITLTAEGAADNDEITLKFASQPYLPQEDIIFVILTGLTRAEYNQFGGTGLSLGAPILGQLGPGSGNLPLEIRVYKQYSEKSDMETTRVELGRWLTPNVWVSFSSSIGEDKDVAAVLDYKINDNFSFSGGYENDNEGKVGNVGMDLKFRLEF